MAPTLGYWDVRGLSEGIRYLLHYVGETFQDKRYTFDRHNEWLEEKFTLGLDFPNLPYFIDGDLRLTQSTVILRYLARKYNLAGSSESERLRMEVFEQQLVDYRTRLSRVAYNKQNFEKEKEELLKVLPIQVELLSKFLGNKKYFFGDKPTYVDFLAYDVLDFYELFHPPIYENHPNLKEYLKRFRNIAQLQKYFNSTTYKRWPIFSPHAHFGGAGDEPKRA